MAVHLHRIDWNGMAILIRHTTGQFAPDFDHLEIETEKPERATLPITETGYRSHFLPSATLHEFGGAVALVLAWLDAESNSEAWTAHIAQAKQLSLF